MSDFICWQRPNKQGPAIVLSACGVNNIPLDYRGSYRFDYTGQTAAAYNEPDAQGVAQTRFGSDASGDSPFGWQSFFIQC